MNTKTRHRSLPAKAALAAGSLALTGAVLAAATATATAPEPAWLSYDLSQTWQHAIYTNTGTQTYGFQMSKEWTYNHPYRQYVGYPCINFNAPAGTTLPGYIVTSGNWSRCAGL